MPTLDELTEAYVTAGEVMFKAEADLEKAFEKAKASLPERAIFRKAEAALSGAVRLKEEAHSSTGKPVVSCARL